MAKSRPDSKELLKDQGWGSCQEDGPRATATYSTISDKSLPRVWQVSALWANSSKERVCLRRVCVFLTNQSLYLKK